MAKTFILDGAIGQGDGEISALMVRSWLQSAAGDDIEVYVHSEGGSVFEGFAIHDAIAAYPGRKVAVVASAAFSAASFILCAFDEVQATPNAYTMIHNAHFEEGDETPSQKKLLANLCDRMAGIYARKTGKPLSVIQRAMAQEVFYDAEASIDFGLVDRITVDTTQARTLSASMMHRVLASAATKVSARQRWLSAIDAKAATGMTRAKAIMAVERERPGLRKRMLAEANARPAARRTVATAGATAKWKAAINAKITAGVPRAKAIVSIDREQPGLREAMLREVNGR